MTDKSSYEKPCTRCGECCRHGGPCDIRRWVTDTNNMSAGEFDGVCDLLIDHGNGTTSCRGILMAFDPPVGMAWYEPTRKWIMEVLVPRACGYFKRAK